MSRIFGPNKVSALHNGSWQFALSLNQFYIIFGYILGNKGCFRPFHD